MNPIKNTLIFISGKRNDMLRFCLFLIICMQCLILSSCKEDIVSYKKQIETYGDTLVKTNHTIHFSLPSKYKKLGDNKVPSLYSEYVYVDYRNIRENIYIADTVRQNWFLYDVCKCKTSNSSDFISACQVQMPIFEHLYNFTEERKDNGTEKFVFVAFYPEKMNPFLTLNDEEDLFLRLLINCFIKTSDGFCIEFKIQSYETLAEFNYQEKMDIINSIYVE